MTIIRVFRDDTVISKVHNLKTTKQTTALIIDHDSITENDGSVFAHFAKFTHSPFLTAREYVRYVMKRARTYIALLFFTLPRIAPFSVFT